MGWPDSDLHAIVLDCLQQLSGGELCSDCVMHCLDCGVSSKLAVQQLLKFAGRKCTQQRNLQPDAVRHNSVKLWQVGKLL